MRILTYSKIHSKSEIPMMYFFIKMCPKPNVKLLPVHQEAEAVHIQVLPEQLMAEAEENSDNRCIKIKAYVHYEHTLVFIYPDV